MQTPYSSISISNASQLHLKPRDVSSAAATGPDWVHAGHGVVKKGEVPSSFAAASEELARLATPGSVWPAEARAAVEAVATKLGGLFFVVVCGTFAEPHPRAGQPAYSLFQMVFVAVTAATANEQTPYSVGRSPVVVHALRAPGDMPLPMLHIIAYELDSDGWPKGERAPADTCRHHSLRGRLPDPGCKSVCACGWHPLPLRVSPHAAANLRAPLQPPPTTVPRHLRS